MPEDGDNSLEQLNAGGKLVANMHLDANMINDETMAFFVVSQAFGLLGSRF